ncbi:MAG: hypothetical protein ACWGO1_07600, partial [Anaerolineales bacterium]
VVMIGSVLFSGKAIVVKLAYLYGVDAATLIALRMLFAAPIFAIVYFYVASSILPLVGFGYAIFNDHPAGVAIWCEVKRFDLIYSNLIHHPRMSHASLAR